MQLNSFMTKKNTISADPRVHAAKISFQLKTLQNQLRAGVIQFSDAKDAQARALFETSAEVLIGLDKAFQDFKAQNENWT